jgi:hypothetical protein
MSSIFNRTVGNTENLLRSYEGIIGDIATVAKSLREEFLQNGTIVAINDLSDAEAAQTSLCAIDGASASDKMQSADLLIAGSSLHDGARSKQIYTGTGVEPPSLSYSDIRLHSSKNDEILSAMRAFTEIYVLGEAPHDVSIIDGAYLGNFLTVLYKLQESPLAAERIIQFLREDTNGYFIKGLRKIFNVDLKKSTGQEVVALAKSDSSREMVREYTDGQSFFVTDKILAEYLLAPGEMLLPLDVKANKDKVSMLEFISGANNWTGFRWNPKKVLSKEDFSAVESFFTLGDKDADKDLFSYYTYLYDFKSYHYTYFKPSKFNPGSHALRLEFTTRGINKNVPADLQHRIDKASELVGYVNADVINAAVREPFSQFMVDKSVKMPVSASMKQIKATIPALMKSENNPMGLVASYRT